MQIPLEVRFHDVDRSEWSENFIREQVSRLERHAPDMIACRVTVARPHRHQRTGQAYHVRVEVTLPPRKDLVAVAEPKEVPTHIELRTVIRDAFRAMEQQLRRVRAEPLALVDRLFPEEGYGFLRTLDGRDIYFHRNSVLHHDFDRLAVGTEVRFVEEEGDEGPQASTVQVIENPAERAGEGVH